MARFVSVDNINTFSTSTYPPPTSTYGGVDTDWQEDDDFHIFKFNLSGLKRDDVRVQVVGGDTLQVSGVRKNESEKLYGKWHIKERPTGAFFRKFQLPGNVKANEVTAFDDLGVLVVTVPKRKHFIRDIPISML